MNNATSPLESLAAFAIAFTAGAITTAALSVYSSYLRQGASKKVDAADAG